MLFTVNSSFPGELGLLNAVLIFFLQLFQKKTFDDIFALKEVKSLTPVLFPSLAVLNLRVGHTMDVLSPFISILCHSD